MGNPGMLRARQMADDAVARGDDPDTSHAAAERMVDSGKAATLSAAVVLCLQRWVDGLTSAEIAAMISEPRDSVSPRMKNLERAGLVQRATARRERKTVWVLSQQEDDV